MKCSKALVILEFFGIFVMKCLICCRYKQRSAFLFMEDFLPAFYDWMTYLGSIEMWIFDLDMFFLERFRSSNSVGWIVIWKS
jgi:hypothetical protein